MFSTKRPRDEDQDELDQLQAQGKRLRSLPFRDSPSSGFSALSFSVRHVSKPPSLAPAGGSSSSSADSSPEPTFTSPPYPVRPTLPAFVTTDDDADMDYAMGDDHTAEAAAPNLGSPMWSPKTPAATFLGPSPGSIASPAYPQLLAVASPLLMDGSAARVPTPMHGNFASAAASRPTLSNFTGASNSLSPIPAPGTAGPELLANDPLRRRRPLPSPISEYTHDDSPTTLMRDLDMGGASPADAAGFPPVDVLTPVSPEFVEARRTSSSASGDSFASTITRSGSESSTTGRRRRSDAISGGESGGAGKVVFSMGFRADCEKCREKVPGHYSHVLRV